ncbi:MAG: GNAT family N-acetyltransferase [Ornithinimicrobium sp.]|uniref:GNAT family N-acetyltransferase n=1 Tax=Ornithinimicrobium sp. TaxID=1977084 RepID=UPI003D9BB0D9
MPRCRPSGSPAAGGSGWRQRLTGVDGAWALEAGDTARVPEDREDGIVGFICVGPARDEDAPTAYQLWAINLVPEHQGTGLAQRLMAEVLGDGPAYLWVATGNERAIRFYQRHGFAADGAETADQHDVP